MDAFGKTFVYMDFGIKSGAPLIASSTPLLAGLERTRRKAHASTFNSLYEEKART